MRFWFSRSNGVPLREQLVTQVMLGVASGDLAPGQRLPSTREMARRFKIHANTISSAYRQLEREHWVESRQGSGVYVKDGPRQAQPTAGRSATAAADYLIAELFRSARKAGISLSEVSARMQRRLAAAPCSRLLVVEPDRHLREIIVFEMRSKLRLPVAGEGPEALSSAGKLAGALVAVLPSKKEAVERNLPIETECITLQVASVPSSLAGYLPAPAHALVGIASHWAEFLSASQTMLAAAGFEAEQLLIRDANKPGWLRALDQTAAVLCDCVTAAELPKSCRAIVFSLLSEASIDELRRLEAYLLCDT